MRRKQATLRCKEATQLGAPSRLKGQTGRTEKVERLKGRTDIVHGQFKELCTDPSQAEILEWIEQRWPCETLHSLPMIDGERVWEIAFAFRKRTSCAEDQVVIEMLRELDTYIWETIASCFQFRLMNR